MPTPTAVTQSEAAVLDDVVARLVATGEFGDTASAEVGWGGPLDLLFPDATGPSAAIEYLGSTETPIADIDFLIKDGRYALTISIRHDDPRGQGTALSQLAAVCRNAVSEQSLGGFCQPFWCRLSTDAPARAAMPEGRLALQGTFRYAINDDADRDESDDT